MERRRIKRRKMSRRRRRIKRRKMRRRRREGRGIQRCTKEVQTEIVYEVFTRMFG